MKLLVDRAQVRQEQAELLEAELVPRKHLQLKTSTRIRILHYVACDCVICREAGMHKCSVIYLDGFIYTPLEIVPQRSQF